MNEPSLGVPNRLRAVASLPQIPHPSQDTLDALKAAASAAGQSRDEATVRNSATYAIGTLERRTRDKDAALAGRARDDIREKLKSKNPAEVAAALSAIGNSGDRELMTDLRPHLSDTDVAIRRQAITALGSMPVDSDANAFGATFDAQSAPRLRALTAAEFADQARFSGTDPPAPVVADALSRLGKEPDASVRVQLIQLLGLVADTNANVRKALAGQYGAESDPSVQAAIGQFVSAGDLP
jgi:HEAT repeat protein